VQSAASYSASTVPTFQAEALALVAWRDAMWQAAIAFEPRLIDGAAEPVADFLKTLPDAPARPVA